MGYFTNGSNPGFTPSGGGGSRPFTFNVPTESEPAGAGPYNAAQFVQRPDLNRVFGEGANLAVAAGRAPGYIAERPLAWANTLTKGPGQDKGIVDQGLDFIKGIPVLGPALGMVGDAISTPWAAKLLNSGTASALSATYGLPDETPLPFGSNQTAQGFFNALPGIGPLFAIADALNGANIQTVGDLRRYAFTQGFTPQDVQDLHEGKRGTFDFGDVSVHENPLFNLGAQLALDPTNLAFGIGAATKLPMGVGLLSKFWKLAGKAEPEAFKAWTAGRKLSTDWATLPYKGFAEKVAQIGRGTTIASRAYLGTAVGATAAELGLTALDDAAGDNSPISGFLEPLADFARRAQKDEPLSKNVLFSLVAALRFPYHDSVQAARSRLGALRYTTLGSGVLPAVVRELAPDLPTYKAQLRKAAEDFGGEMHVLQFVEWAIRDIAAERVHRYFNLVKPDTQVGVDAFTAWADREITRVATEAMQKGSISPQQVVERMKQIATNARQVGEMSSGVRFPWMPHMVGKVFTDWRIRVSELAQMFDNRAPVVLKMLSDLPLPLEHYQILRGSLESLADEGGMIARTRLAEMLHDYPQLLRDEPLKTQFAKYLIPDGPAQVAVKEVTDAIKLAEEKAQPLSSYLFEFRDWEARHQATMPRTRAFDPITRRWSKDAAIPVGQVRVLTPGFLESRARHPGMKSQNMDDVAALRGDPNGKWFEGEAAKALDQAGFPVQAVTQTVMHSAERGELLPHLDVTIKASPTAWRDAGRIGVALVEAGVKKVARQGDYFIREMSGRMARSLGMKPNAVRFRWQFGALNYEQGNALAQLAKRFGGNFDDHRSTFELWVRNGDLKNNSAEEVAQAIAHAVPEDPVVGRLKPQREPVYIEKVANDARAGVKGDEVLSNVRRDAATDPRYVSASTYLANTRPAAGVAERLGGPGGRRAWQPNRSGVGSTSHRAAAEQRVAAWKSPGKRPERPDTGGSPEFYKAESKWQAEMSRGVAIGKITPEKAKAEGWNAASREVVPLPDVPLYHASVNAPAIHEGGFRTPDDLGGQKGIGGGADDAISFTTDPAIAQRYAEALVEGHEVAMGAITPDDLLARAEQGQFAHGEMGMVDLVVKQDITKLADMPVAEVWDMAVNKRLVLERTEMGTRAVPPGAIPAGSRWMGGDGIERHSHYWRPATDAEYAQLSMDIYRKFLAAQEHAGGPADPFFWSMDPERFRQIDPAKVGVVEVRPRPGSMGTQHNAAEAEWRTWSGDAVQIVGKVPPAALPQRVADALADVQRAAAAGEATGPAVDAFMAALHDSVAPSAIPDALADLRRAVTERYGPEPTLVSGGSAFKDQIPTAKASEPSFTIKANPGEPVRAIVNGKVVRLWKRAIARLQSVPDDFPLPESEALARTVLGNGVPPPMAKAILDGLVPLMGERPTGVSLFSGAGLWDLGAEGAGIRPLAAVEYDPAIAAAYTKAHGEGIMHVGDVRHVDFTPYRGASALHASPVCKDFSLAKAQKGELELDLETADATARAIREIDPRVVTIENVAGYRNSSSMKIITDELEARGYTYDIHVLDAADFGVPQHRERMILRAVKDGELPPLPAPKPHVGWWDAVKDLAMPEEKLASWQAGRLAATQPELLNPVPPALDDALMLAHEDFVATGGNMGQVIFNAKLDRTADAILPIFDKSLSEAPLELKKKLADFQRRLVVEKPAYTVALPPSGQVPLIWSNKVGQVVADYMKPRASWMRDLFDNGPLSKAAAFQRALFAPRGAFAAADATKQELYNTFLNHGAQVNEVNGYIDALREISNLFEIRGVKIFRSYDSMPISVYEKVALGQKGTISKGPFRIEFDPSQFGFNGFSDKVIQSVKPGNFWKLIDASSSSWWRNVTNAARAGGVRGRVGRQLAMQYPKAMGVRHYAKVWYHVFRFLTDPRWWLMNEMEAEVMLGMKWGVNVRGSTGTKPSKIADFHLAGGRPAPEAQLALDAAASGWYDTRRTLGAIVRTFDADAPRSVNRMLDALPESDPIIQLMVKKFGEENRGSWGQRLIDDIESLDTRGAKATVEDEAHKIWAAQEYAEMEQAGVLQRVWDLNEQRMNDMNRTLRGNPDRNLMERMLNSYWLYWPISYQLKAGKWLYDILTHKMFGKQTNLGGAYMLSHITDLHERMMRDDPEYVAMFKDNPETWFFAQMFVPITPFDMGVSLGRAAKVAGGAAGLWEAPSYSSNPFMFAAKIAAMGPVFTYEMLRHLGSEQDPLDFLLKPFNKAA